MGTRTWASGLYQGGNNFTQDAAWDAWRDAGGPAAPALCHGEFVYSQTWNAINTFNGGSSSTFTAWRNWLADSSRGRRILDLSFHFFPNTNNSANGLLYNYRDALSGSYDSYWTNGFTRLYTELGTYIDQGQVNLRFEWEFNFSDSVDTGSPGRAGIQTNGNAQWGGMDDTPYCAATNDQPYTYTLGAKAVPAHNTLANKIMRGDSYRKLFNRVYAIAKANTTNSTTNTSGLTISVSPGHQEDDGGITTSQSSTAIVLPPAWLPGLTYDLMNCDTYNSSSLYNSSAYQNGNEAYRETVQANYWAKTTNPNLYGLGYFHQQAFAANKRASHVEWGHTRRGGMGVGAANSGFGGVDDNGFAGRVYAFLSNLVLQDVTINGTATPYLSHDYYFWNDNPGSDQHRLVTIYNSDGTVSIPASDTYTGAGSSNIPPGGYFPLGMADYLAQPWGLAASPDPPVIIPPTYQTAANQGGYTLLLRTH